MNERLMEELQSVKWRPKPDIDTFFSFLCSLHKYKTVKNIYITYIEYIFDLFCTFILLFLLLDILNWNRLSSCHNIQSCSEIQIINFSLTFFSTLYFLATSICLIVYMCYLYKNIKVYEMISQFLININIQNIDKMTWEELINKLRHKKPLLSINDDEISYDVHIINNIIMRTDNIFIALITSGCIPSWCISRISEFSVKNVIINTWIFERKSKKQILQKSRIYGAVLLATCPFTIIYVFVFILMKNINDLKRIGIHALFSRNIRHAYSYSLRRFNELDFDFEKRKKEIEKNYRNHSASYIYPVQNLLQDILFTICSCAFIYMFCISTINDLVLIYTSWPVSFGPSLLWWFAIASSVLTCRKNEGSCDVDASEIQYVYSHHIFSFRFIEMFSEIFSCLLSSIIFLFYIPNRIQCIASTLELCTCQTKIGILCKYSQFNVDIDDNTSKNITNSTILNEKLRNSMYDFQISNPEWYENLSNSERMIIDHAYEDVLQPSIENTSSLIINRSE